MKLFKDLKIATKLILGFIIISIIAGVIGGIGIVNIRIINSMDTKMYENTVMPMQNLSIVLQTYHRIRANLRDMALSTDNEYRLTTTDKIKERENTLFENLALVAENIRDDKLLDSYNSLNDLLNGKYKEYQDSVINLLNTNQDKKALELIYGDGDDINTEVQTLFDDFYNQLVTQAKQKADSNTDTSTTASYIMFAVILVSIIAALLLGVSISRMISNPIKKLVNAADKLAIGDFSINAEINSKDEIGTLEKSFVEVINNIKNLMPVIDTLTNACVEGRLDKRAEVGSFKGSYKDIISSLNNMMDTLVGHIDVMPSPVMIIDKDFNIQYMNKLGAEILGTSQKQLIGTKCYDNFKTSDCKTMKCACAGAMQQGTRINSETDAHPRGMNLEISYSALPIKDKNQRAIGAIELISDQTVIKNAQKIAKKQNEYQNSEVTKLLANIENLSQGRLTYNAAIEPTDEDTKEIGDMFKRIYSSYGASIDAINSYIKEIGEILTEMSNCNLNVETSGEYKGDFIEIKNSLDSIINSFNETISNINTASEQVASGSDQISNSSMTLSQGATEQASSIEELTASLEEISSQTKLNAQNANQANELAENAKTNAIQGNGQMKEMLKAMEEINESSANISKIIKVIDDIAFQTNILALNAAVEAARAGQHGKGFAVVAEEVRNLAARSANAAKETTEMIEGSIKKAEGGTRIAKDTADALGKIVNGVEKVANLVNDIAVASNEQASGISQINQGIMQVSQVVQSNSATSEESAAASQELSSQAALMRDMVSRFKLKRSNRSYGKMEDLSPEVLAMLENMTDKKNKHSESAEDKKNSRLKQVKPRITLSDKEFGKY